MAGISPESVYTYLEGMNYPARKKELINQAKENDAGNMVIEAIESLPEKEY